MFMGNNGAQEIGRDLSTMKSSRPGRQTLCHVSLLAVNAARMGIC